ncbi:type II toxin-antitoxin system RelE/ParE family toxin [Brevibacillus sp. B_LB10_24]|uniref:type II toxin-antitoxin system RelE/ParE family toxin n=1 Tax=Brevibacillus sp. B_LB10_24 TaxID=3380645 RepID=UPI0038BA6827
MDYIDEILAPNPYIGAPVTGGAFHGFRRIIYGKNKHRMPNYLIYYAIHENDHIIDVINILPSRSERRRIRR